MQASLFNVRVPLEDRNQVFLMNTFTDAQLLVSPDVVGLLDRLENGEPASFTAAEHEALEALTENGFVVETRAQERRDLEDFFTDVRESTDQLRVTVLTTLQCNFACDYCIQGDHGEYNKTAAKMSMDMARRVGDWIESRMETVRPASFSMMFFGGEPLLNMPVIYYLAERLWHACGVRRIPMTISIVTNGLLLTEEVVDRLNRYGLSSVKITLDGDRDTHNRMRPLRGGQGTFDKIIANVRRIAHKTRVGIGGNFDMETAGSYPALLDFLAEQEFADKIARVAFKPVIREKQPVHAKGFIPLTAVGTDRKPLGGACMTSAGTGVSSACDTCNVVDEKMSFLREETKKRGFKTVDGVHMGPCEIHKAHAHTIGPDGAIYACPGFAGEPQLSVGHIDEAQRVFRSHALQQFERLSAWKECRDCPFIPVCAGGCTVAAHNELGDMHAPNCHKTSFEAGVLTLAREAAREMAL